jgi:hypothetical protein
MKDATGKEFVEGRKYGYYVNKSGYTRVIIGVGKPSNAAGKIKLLDCEEKTYLYNDGIQAPLKVEIRKNPTLVFCNIIFPIWED